MRTVKNPNRLLYVSLLIDSVLSIAHLTDNHRKNKSLKMTF